MAVGTPDVAGGGRSGRGGVVGPTCAVPSPVYPGRCVARTVIDSGGPSTGAASPALLQGLRAHRVGPISYVPPPASLPPLRHRIALCFRSRGHEASAAGVHADRGLRPPAVVVGDHASVGPGRDLAHRRRPGLSQGTEPTRSCACRRCGHRRPSAPAAAFHTPGTFRVDGSPYVDYRPITRTLCVEGVPAASTDRLRCSPRPGVKGQRRGVAVASRRRWDLEPKLFRRRAQAVESAPTRWRIRRERACSADRSPSGPWGGGAG
jgi:hypothetical protein